MESEWMLILGTQRAYRISKLACFQATKDSLTLFQYWGDFPPFESQPSKAETRMLAFPTASLVTHGHPLVYDHLIQIGAVSGKQASRQMLSRRGRMEASEF